MMLAKFHQSAINVYGRTYINVDTGASIKGKERDGDSFTSVPFSTLTNISGALIRNPSGNTFYLAGDFHLTATGVYNGTLFNCQQPPLCLYRFVESTKGSFGRPSATTRTPVSQDVHVHFLPSRSSSVDEAPDRHILDRHRQILVQSLHGVIPADVLTTSYNDSFRVLDIEKYQYGLTRVFLELLTSNV